MARIETWFDQDLNDTVKVRYIDGNLFSQDNAGNMIGVRLSRNGVPYSGGGTVAANVIRPDGTTVAVAGALSGNVATVVLPQAAYAIIGAVTIIVKLTVSGAVTTISASIANVYRSSTDDVVDPGTIIPTIETLIAEIEAAVASIPADYSSLWTSLAPAFSSSASYLPGHYATYNGALYRFIANHSGTWDSGDVVGVSVGGEILENLRQVAPVFSSSDSYSAGQYVTYGNLLYRFIANHSGAWDSSDVAAVSVGGALYTLGNADFYGKTIVVSTQEALEAIDSGIYADADTFPRQSIISLYLSGTANVDNAPETTRFSWFQRATVMTYSPYDRNHSGYSGTVQVWYDMTNHAVFYRSCWESSNTWSAWAVNAGDELTGIANKYSIGLNDEYLQTKKTAKANVPLFVSGKLTTSGVSQNTYFRIIGFYNNNEDNDVLMEYGNFSETLSIIIPTRDYENIVIHGNSLPDVDAIAPYTAEVTVINAFDNLPNLVREEIDSAKNSGIMTRYKTKYQQICKLHGLSGNHGDVLTIRLLYSNGSAQKATLFGLYGSTQSAGYDNLGDINVGAISTFELSRNYAGFQTYVNTTGDTAPIEYEMEAAVNLGNGIQKDVIKLINDSSVLLNKHTCNIFHKVVCIGDSYTSGHIQLQDDPVATPTNEDYAWPHFMEQLTGNTYVNCGQSGATTISWQTTQRGLPKAQASGLAQAYIIGLMINDSAPVEGGGTQVPLGSASDIGTNNATFYAQMSKIIREVNAISPLAKIFVNTCPDSDTARYNDFNEAVRTIVNTYASTYPVHCIDLARDYRQLYAMNSLQADYVKWHYTALGYEQFAEIYAYVLSDYIDKNVDEFQDVFRIPYEN